ncbi:MAG: DUF3618 domain-containing protein, partial [Candidatus Dormibacteraceae bacterium]
MTISSVENGIRQNINRTREQRADAVEALAHKVDVPARVKTQAHDIKETMQDEADEVTQHVQHRTETLQTKASKVALRAKSVTRWALVKLPPRLATSIEPVTTTVKQRPLPT